ncbi:MAG: Mrp/NBP35 family ATP-binding protein [Clostridia bacterium]|nr:Mrp/NBP35 family ATP-binding protein [Clostridia bacterium]
MSECTHNCSTCSQNCSERDLREPLGAGASVKRVIGVVSGKGGVGKSMVTSLLAVSMQRLGYRTAILDADVTGPSIPKMFSLKGPAQATDSQLLPSVTKTGLQVRSTNLLLPNDTDPVVWRGPVISGVVKQFWGECLWNDVDYMFVDMPPGTGDVCLTVFQSIPVDGIVVVTSPQELVSMIVTKALKMADLMNVPVIGLVENYSWIECPDCGKRIELFGKSNAAKTAEEAGIPLLASLPMNAKLAAAGDAGTIELFEGDWLEDATNAIVSQFPIEE